ncbi:cation diffusion facilitator family transporter, partial [Arhodomonas sp. KWT]
MTDTTHDHTHDHDHRHGHGHDHDHTPSSGRALLIGLVLTGGFALVELVAGWLSGSLALIGDAGHMVTDSLALGLGALASRLSQRPPSERHSFGFQRAEIVGALVNAGFMLVVVAWIAYEAVQRLIHPVEVQGGMVLVVAAIGLAMNVVVLRVLHGGEQNLNTQGAILHVLGDLLGSVAALASGLVIALTGWFPIDPL